MCKSLCAFLLLVCEVCIAQSPQFITYKDGSFDIVGNDVKLRNCYPAIDQEPVRPLKVTISTPSDTVATLQYLLSNGEVSLTVIRKKSDLTLQTTVTGDLRPVSILPIHNAKVEGASSYFRTPGSIMGNGGIHSWPDQKKEQCPTLTGLLPDKGDNLLISARDVHNYYTNVELGQLNGKKVAAVSLQTEKAKPTNLPTIYITQTPDAYRGMRAEASKIAQNMGVKNDKPQAYLWCSWYYTFSHLTDEMLKDYLKGFDSIAPKIPVQTIQIDAGYCPHAGDWLEPSEKFPQGLGSSVKNILSKGYKAGIWIGPYIVGNRSKLYREHPEWILHWADGTKVMFYTFYDEQRMFEAQDEEYYVLDTSNPAVMEYLRSVFRAFKKMGITYFKTDFMIWGDQASHNLKRHTPGKTSLQYQREFFDMIRSEIGQESFWLGCIAPFAPLLGYVDGMRISADITAKWDGATNMFDESKGAQHINNVWWQNDPDAMILRKKYNRMSDAESQSVNSWMGLLGGIVNTSDLFHELPAERLAFFRSLQPQGEKFTAELPFLTKQNDLEVLVRPFSSGSDWVVLFVNRKEVPVTVTIPVQDLISLKEAWFFPWNEQSYSPAKKYQEVKINLAPHCSTLFYVNSNGKNPIYEFGGQKRALKK